MLNRGWIFKATQQITVEDVVLIKQFAATDDYRILISLLRRWMTPQPPERALLNLTIPEMTVLRMELSKHLQERAKVIVQQVTDLDTTTTH